MTPSLVSVILPTHNRAEILLRSAQSVLDQTYRDLELVVVDDCSSDSTLEKLAKIEDPRLKIIRLQVNAGPSAARNVGIRAAAGSFIAFQDSDTEWLPDKLAKQMKLLLQAGPEGHYPVACYSRFMLVRGRKKTEMPSDPAKDLSGYIYPRVLHGNTMSTPVIVVRRDILDAVGLFDEELVNLEDWDLALRICANNSVAFVDESTLIAHDSPGSVNKRLSPESLVAILEKHLAEYEALPQAMAGITWLIGCAYAKRNQRSKALQYMKLSLDRESTRSKKVAFAAVRGGLNFYPALYHARKLLRP